MVRNRVPVAQPGWRMPQEVTVTEPQLLSVRSDHGQ
jgi:hypothetical protein